MSENPCDRRAECCAFWCASCKEYEFFEPRKLPMSYAQMVEMAIAEGVTVIRINEEGEYGWHCDLFDREPEKWFSIPKPWTFRFLFVPHRLKMTRYPWYKRFPVDWYVDRWMFSYYRNDTIQGCSMVMHKGVTPERALAYALSNFHCAMAEECGQCPNDCENCDHKDVTLR